MSLKYLSTTALAKLIQKESRELFSLLSQGGWIIKVDNHWQLTEKGRFEGGVYLNHPKYGEYIAWPESVQEHSLLRLLPEAPLSATHLSQKVELPARLINLLLAERGWIKRHIRGWLLTVRGKALGGEQHFNEQTGIPYATWPETLLVEPSFLASIAQIKGEAYSVGALALSGQPMTNKFSFVVENWLYLANVHHACHYAIQVGTVSVCADFFLPDNQVVIEVWNPQATAAELSVALEKQAFYKEHGYELIEIHEEHFAHLDEYLAKQLFQYGIAVY